MSSNAISMTGRVAGQQVESSLERDFATLLKFDRAVDRWLTQPVTIEYAHASGRELPYTPDFMVVYRRAAGGGYVHPPRLCEVKYQADLRKNAHEYAPKFEAARSYCAERSWVFEVFSEREIRTALLDNARFLLPYRHRSFDPRLVATLLAWFADRPEGSVGDCLSNTPADLQLVALAAIWHLVATGRLIADLHLQKITNSSVLRLSGAPE